MVRWSKGAVALALAAVLILGVLPKAALAEGNAPVSVSLQGKPLAAKGELVYGTTFVPVKALGVELGFNVTAYDPARVTVAGPNNRVVFGNGSSLATVSGHETYCGGLPFIENDQLMVPARFLLESMGYQLTWSDKPSFSIDLIPVTLNNFVIGTVRERQETATLIIDLQYPKLSGLESRDVQDAMNAYFASSPDAMLQQAYQNEKDMIAGGYTQWPTEASRNYTVEYNQNGFLGLLLDNYLYLGGAHGSTIRTGYFADVKTGKTYATLKDLFKDGTDYISLLSPEVKKQFDAMGEGAALASFERIRPDQGFYIKGNDLVIYFDVYEYTPYAAGFPEFHIPLPTLSNVLVPELAALAK